jgi:hypothetical protein
VLGVIGKSENRKKMDQLSRVQAYFNERERRKLDKKVKESGSAFPDMTVCWFIFIFA